MGSPYLNPDETILLSTHNLVVNTVPAEAILTSNRLILVDTRDSQIHPQDIPFTAIETVTAGENSAADPMLSLSIATGPGLTQSLGIVFLQTPKAKRIGERDEWMTRLKEFSAAAARDVGVQSMEILPPWVPGQVPGSEEGTAGADVTGSGYNPPLMPKPRPERTSKNRTAVAIGALVVIIVAIAVTGYFIGPSLPGISGPSASPNPTPISTPATPATVTPVPPTPTIPPVTTVITSPPTVIPTAIPGTIIPPTGVWVQIKYPGNYSGIIGAPGRYATITGSGDHFYQIPARNETITATVQKLDNTGNVLTVEFYNEGTLIKSGSVRAPKGTLEIFADLKTA